MQIISNYFVLFLSFFKEQSTKIKLSDRCRALILSPLRLMRLFSERRQLYQLVITKIAFKR